MSGLQNVGLTANHKSVFDSSIYALTDLLKEEIINKIVRRLLGFNFAHDLFKNNLGEFRFEQEEDEQSVNSRLSTISSLIASGILDANDPDILMLIKKKLGLPTLDEVDKEQTLKDKRLLQESQDMQNMLQQLQAQIQLIQTKQQLDAVQNPAPPPPPDEGATQAAPTGDEAELKGQ
jgi:hypothetical protein